MEKKIVVDEVRLVQKKMTVEVQFSRKAEKYSVKVKALHNGAHLIEKSSLSGNTLLQTFEYACAFIEKHDATNIALKRGVLEDSFAKYLSDIQTGTVEEDKSIEGILVDSISEENQELLADLRTYKMCVQDAVRHEDYEGMLMQGVLYNVARGELEDLEGKLANPFEVEVTLPLSEKPKVIEAIDSLSKAEWSHGIEPLEFKKYNNLIVVTKTDYKLVVNFS